MSYLEVPIKVISDGTMSYRLVGPSESAPTPATGYTIDPEPVELPNVEGKFWIEYKTIIP